MFRHWTGLLLFAAGLAVTGCGGNSVPQGELDRAREAMQASLEAWKSEAGAAKLESQGIQFTDPDQATGARLLNYRLERVEGQQAENIRCWTKISLEDAEGKRTDHEAVYEVRLGTKIIIGRDPFQ